MNYFLIIVKFLFLGKAKFWFELFILSRYKTIRGCHHFFHGTWRNEFWFLILQASLNDKLDGLRQLIDIRFGILHCRQGYSWKRSKPAVGIYGSSLVNNSNTMHLMAHIHTDFLALVIVEVSEFVSSSLMNNSRAMYAGVPINWSSNVFSSLGKQSDFSIPKSHISVVKTMFTRTLPGFKSLWTMTGW